MLYLSEDLIKVARGDGNQFAFAEIGRFTQRFDNGDKCTSKTRHANAPTLAFIRVYKKQIGQMFKKIKQNLLNQHNIGRYLSYAVGEVILIVIGILVAVSINNWNEEKQQKKIESGIFEILVSDIKQDTAEVKKILNFYNNRKATFLKIAHNPLTVDEINACDFCTNLISDWKLLTINKRGIYQLNEYKNYTLSNQDSLIIDIVNFYTILLNEVENFNDLIKEDITGNLTHWRDHYPWFHSFTLDVKLKKEDLSYFGGSQEYRNKVAFHYVLIYKNYLPILQEFQKNAETILKELNKRLNDN